MLCIATIFNVDEFETKMIQTIRGAGYMLKWEDKSKTQL